MKTKECVYDNPITKKREHWVDSTLTGYIPCDEIIQKKSNFAFGWVPYQLKGEKEALNKKNLKKYEKAIKQGLIKV